jgi:hypothetical protein
MPLILSLNPNWGLHFKQWLRNRNPNTWEKKMGQTSIIKINFGKTNESDWLHAMKVPVP